MITVRAKTRSGQIMTYNFDTILDIDGQPYRTASEAATSHEECKQSYAYLSGRIDTLERLIGQPETVTGTAVV